MAAALVSGGLEEEIQVEIDERKLANLGLSINQVVSRLAQENVNLTGGRLREGQTEYLVRTINEFLRPEDMREVVIDRSQGAIVRLSDVARVYMGAKEREIITRIDGLESVEVAVYKEGGTNTVMVANAVLEQVDELRQKLQRIDPTLELTVITDQADYIRESVSAVIETAIIGGLLAIVILYLFLRSVKNTLIIGISIPVSIMATFFLMYVFDVSLNIMSLGGLTLGVGLLLDNSIVVLEAISRKRKQGLEVEEAAREGASQVGRAVTASTITTICVFAPIVFVEGVAGQLFGDQALTVTFSLLVSLVVALTLIPMFASRHLEWEVEDDIGEVAVKRSSFLLLVWGRQLVRAVQKALWLLFMGIARALKLVVGAVAWLASLLVRPLLIAFDAILRNIGRVYARVLDGALSAPLAVIFATLLLFGGSFFLFRGLGQELVPELVQGEFLRQCGAAAGGPASRSRSADWKRSSASLSVSMVCAPSTPSPGARTSRAESRARVARTSDSSRCVSIRRSIRCSRSS